MHPIPATKDAIKALIAARPAWADVDVRDGQPTKAADVTRSMFWFEPTELPQDGWSWIGAQRRKTTFLLGFTIAVLREGDDERDGENVVWDLFEDLMTALKTDYSLGGLIQQVQDVTGRQINEPVPNQWQARFTGSIQCQSKSY